MIQRLAVAVFALALSLGCGDKALGADASNLAPPPAAHGGGIRAATILIVHGKIVKVDRARKLVTLMGPDGGKVTIKVENPYNLAAAKPGAPFVARFKEVVKVRRKKPGEVLAAVSVKEGITTAAPGQTPGGAIRSKQQVVVTVSAIDDKDRTVTVKGPDGAEETLAVMNPDILARVKVGEELVVTESQKIAISFAQE